MLNRIPRRLKQHSVEKEPMQSTVTFITDFKDKESLSNSPPFVMSYSTRGFTIKDIKVFGSVAILPSAFYHWRVSDLRASISTGFPDSLVVPIYSWVERGTVRVKCLAHNTMTQPGLEPGPLDPESSVLTTRPPRVPSAY